MPLLSQLVVTQIEGLRAKAYKDSIMVDMTYNDLLGTKSKMLLKKVACFNFVRMHSKIEEGTCLRRTNGQSAPLN